MNPAHWLALFAGVLLAAAVAAPLIPRRDPLLDGPEAKAIDRYLMTRGYGDVRVERLSKKVAPEIVMAYVRYNDDSGKRRRARVLFQFPGRDLARLRMTSWDPLP